MRYLKYALLILIALVLLTLALANREVVTLRLLPGDMAAFLGVDYRLELPLFLVIIGGVVTGLVVGFVWEWLREYRHRAAAVRARAEADRLESELERARRRRAAETAPGEDAELLALLEDRKAG